MEAELWKARYEASELRHEVQKWKEACAALQNELGHSNRLLRQQRLPPRPRLTQMERVMVAARQKFKCDGGDGCPLRTVNEGVFTEAALWEIDHIGRGWAKTGRHSMTSVVALCPHCHAVRTREQILCRAESGEEGGVGPLVH